MSKLDRAARSGASPTFLALSCVGFIASATGAHAQNAPATGDEEAVELRGVTVTDTAIDEPGFKVDRADSPKFTAPLIDTPRSVVVIPAQIINQTGSATLVEALRTVPGISFGAGEGGNPLGDRPFIRGFDSQASTYLDGVRDTGAQSREVFNVEQIEIVKGSNSAMGGRGSAGGSLNLVSKAPQKDTFIAGSASYGTDDYKRITGDVNYRVNDLVAVRLNGMWHDQDVAGRDALYQKRWGVAPSIKIGVEGSTSLTLQYYHLESDELPDSGIPYLYTAANKPAGVTRVGPATSLNGQNVDLDNFYGLTNRDFRDTKVDQATLRVEHRFDGGITVRNTTRYGKTGQDYIFTNPDDSAGNVAGTATQPPGRVARSPKTRFGTTELFVNQLDIFGETTIAGIKNSFSGGAEFAHEKAVRGSFTVVSTPRCPTRAGVGGSPPGSPPYNCTSLFDPNPDDPFSGAVTQNASTTTTITDATTKSLYLFDTLTLTEALLVNLGVRYDDFATGVRGPVAAGRRPIFTRRDKLWSYQAGIVFKPTPNTSLYTSYATSNSPPGSFIGEGSEGNALNVTADDLKVEKTRSFEVGAKAELFDAKLSLTLAAFRTDTKNARTAGPNNTIEFVGERRIDGIEFGFNGEILPGWRVFGGYTFLDSEIRDGGITTTTTGANVGFAPSVNTGKQFPNTSRHSFTAFTDYDVTSAITVGGGAIYNSRQIGGYGDTRVARPGGVVTVTEPFARYIPGYWRFDANATYRINDNLDLRVNIQNLTDKRYFDKAYVTHYASIAPGRSAFATLNFRY